MRIPVLRLPGAGALRNLRFGYKVALILVALLIPLGVAVQGQLGATSDDLAVARAERSGLVVIRPLSALLNDTVTESMSPGGTGMSQRLAASTRATDAAMIKSPAPVTGWAPIHQRLLALPETTGEARAAAATRLVPDLVDLLHEVADFSHLILDPDLATYYLMDAVMLRAPGLVSLAGDAERAAADVERGSAGSFRARVLLGSAASVLRQELDHTAASLQKAGTGTDSPPVLATTRSIEQRIRSLSGSVDVIAFAANDANGSVSQLVPAARAIRSAAMTLVTDGPARLDQLLAERVQTLQHQRTVSLLQILAGLLIAGYLAISMHRTISELTDLSTRDALTGLGNHRAFHEDLYRAVAHARRQDEALSVAAVDIDDFKQVNDRRGHRHGDSVLVQVAELLNGRAGDRAFRTGGDEFTVLLRGTDEAAACQAMERLRRAVASAPLPVTVSIGVASLAALSGGDVLSAEPIRDAAEVMLEQADAAVYAAKHAGRNTVLPASRGTASTAVTGAKMRALRALLDRGEVEVVFQPIWHTDRSAVFGYEALARLPVDAALAGPSEAFDVAEALGKAVALDSICLRGIWAAAAHLPPGVLLFVNVCPSTLEAGGLDETAMAAAVRAIGLEPRRVVIEVTERRSESASRLVAACQRLRDAGFRIALDDVGAGNSGLEMLRHLPVEFVKIDREVLVDAQVSETARGVLLAIVAFAREVGAEVIAEGIEDEQMLSFLLGMAPATGAVEVMVHGLQGYLLGRPARLPARPEPHAAHHSRSETGFPADGRQRVALLRRGVG